MHYEGLDVAILALLVTWFMLERSRVYFPSWKYAVLTVIVIALCSFFVYLISGLL